MYEHQNTETIKKRMLDNAPNALDKREGSIIYDATACTAIELELMYAAVDFFIKNTFGDTADREFLIERALERGLHPHDATKAVVKGVFTPIDIDIPIGNRFSCNGPNYAVLRKAQAGEYLLECEMVGTIGNKTNGMLIPIDYLSGLATAKIKEVTIPAIDEEETEAFRKRYLASFNVQAFGGNIADYKAKMYAIAGVGGVKVYPVWNGGGTVKIVFCTTENKTPTSEFVRKVQEIVDPEPYHQQGVGTAPVGHYVTVQGTTDKTVNISMRVTMKDSFNLEDVKPQIKKAIEAYFTELNATWKDTQIVTSNEFSNVGLILRLSRIESKVLDITGVLDVEELKINGNNRNLELGVDDLAKLGEIAYG